MGGLWCLGGCAVGFVVSGCFPPSGLILVHFVFFIVADDTDEIKLKLNFSINPEDNLYISP